MNARAQQVIPAEMEATESTELAVLPAGFEQNASLAVSLARAEVDQQIATARALPRSIKRAVDQILTLATLDEESAQECVYALPRGGKPIRGPSIRLAEIIASQWGNCRVGARVVHVDRKEKYVEAEGVFHDLETNVATTARVRRRLSDKSGRLLNDDMIVVTGNAACAIAKRNAILGAVPKAVWARAYVAVESVIAGDVKTLTERRDRVMKGFAAFGAKPEQVFAVLGIGGMDDVAVHHMPVLVGMVSALKSGESTVEEMFKPQGSPSGRPTLSKALDELAKKPGERATAEGQTGTPAHDAETGEIIETGAASSPAPQDAEAGSAASPASASELLEGEDGPHVDESDPDFQRGANDARNGVRKCLADEIKGSPARLAMWQAGWISEGGVR